VARYDEAIAERRLVREARGRHLRRPLRTPDRDERGAGDRNVSPA
jgi:hypothetical protein